MPATVVLGAQWGDEGKGKAIDQLAPQSKWAVRFQGGNNAGHTIVVGDTTLKLHQIPSGVTSRSCNLVLGDGMVIDPWVLDEELSRWEDLTGEKPEGERLFISERASVILPFHKFYDSADKVVGTTGRGIGPAYRDRIERVGIRFTDIEEVLSDSRIIEETVLRMNKQLQTVGYDKEIQSGELSSQLQWILDRFGSAIKPTGLMVDLALRNGESVLLEGAQGALLDIDQGTYPFVTSSVVGRANATHGAGIHPGHITECFGITKAYCTRVGNGPFPSELSLEEGAGQHMAQVGHEFGTTTGRPRRTGWLDIVALKEAHRISGYSGLVVTKLDVLGGLDEIKITNEKKRLTEKNILSELKKPTSDRILKVAQALRFKKTVKEIHSACKIDPWFIEQIGLIVDSEKTIRKKGIPSNGLELQRIKSLGFSDKKISEFLSPFKTEFSAPSS